MCVLQRPVNAEGFRELFIAKPVTLGEVDPKAPVKRVFIEDPHCRVRLFICLSCNVFYFQTQDHRFKHMSPNQDWTDVWPTAASFKQSSVFFLFWK
jgi:hypothetical protein